MPSFKSIVGLSLASLCLSAPALASGPLNVLTVGANSGNRAIQNYVPYYGSTVGGVSHLGTTVTHVNESQFNALTATQLAAYDVVLTQWASSGALNLSSTTVQAYVSAGGALFLDGDFANYNDLSWVGITGALSFCSGPWLLDTSAVPGGSVLSDTLPAYPSLANCHGQFPNWNPTYLTPFMWDSSGNVAALAGVYGSGRIIVTGPDQDFHAHPGDTNQYQLLLNELEWTGNACDPLTATDDCDDDGVGNGADNCPALANADQADADGDLDGDVCDACPLDADNDIDADGVCGDVDNCSDDGNTDQANADGDLDGDVCDACPLDALNDADTDGHCANVDNCPTVSNASQANSDADPTGDACDTCPYDAQNDVDGDTFCADVDNCPTDANADQVDFDGDDAGDVCDADDDADGVDDGDDLCQTSMPDSSVPVPSRSLKPNHYVWESGTTFTRGASRGTAITYTMTDTAGCSCAEIIDYCGYGEGLSKFGCSPGIMLTWAAGGGNSCE